MTYPRPILLGAVSALLILVAAWWHTQAGASLPYPCGDEVVFYYPAQALAWHGTFSSVHLLPQRDLFWMPPGYMTVLAGWINIAGPGLLTARWLSFLLASAAFIGLGRFWLRLRLPPEGLILIAIAFLSRHWTVMANMARMEALFLCLILLCLQLLWQGRTLAAAGLALLTLTVHPNALYFLAGLPLLAWWAPRRSYSGSVNLGLAALGLLVTGSYALYALAHWDYFTSDWRWQLASRSADALGILLFRPDQAVFIVLVCALAYWAWRTQRRQIGFALTTAVLFWATRVLGQGWAYGIFNVIAVTLVLGCTLAWARVWLWPRLAQSLQAYAPWATASGLALALGFAQIYTLPRFNPADYYWMGMPMHPADAPYFTPADRVAVRTALYRLLPPGTHKVYFMPEGDGMLINTADTGRFVHVLPVFGHNLPEYFVVHRSAIAAFYEEAYHETLQMLPTGSPEPTPFYTRLPDERWYLIKVPGNRYPPYVLLKDDPRFKKLNIKN